jgi:alpha-beta hydrolase superfamily lysophospholipase
MQIEEFYWGKTKTTLYGKQSFPDAGADTVIIMLHGLGEHSGCYEHWAEKFVQQSFGWVIFDWRGHGRSCGKRGHTTLKELNSDLRAVIQRVRAAHPVARLILYGHSMGAHIALDYAMAGGKYVDGIIASSPWLEMLQAPPDFLVRLGVVAARIFPSWTVATGIKSEQLTQYGGGKTSKTDPLIHKRISIKLFSDLFRHSEVLMQNQQWPDVPLLLMHGTSDHLISYRSCVSVARHIGLPACKIWEGMGHDLHNEIDNKAVFQYVLKWIQQIPEHGAVPNHP